MTGDCVCGHGRSAHPNGLRCLGLPSALATAECDCRQYIAKMQVTEHRHPDGMRHEHMMIPGALHEHREGE